MQNFTRVQRPGMAIMGIQCRTSNSPGAAINDIPALWGRFSSEDVFSKIAGKVSDEVIALYCDYEGDHTKPYSVIIGCPVGDFNEVPKGMVAKSIPGGTYALFRAIGEHPKAIVETWGEIWQTDLPRTFTGDYEVYGQKFHSTASPEVEVFIAIEE